MARERQCVSNMFTPPTANQSWRKVLSMGNLLNGHEPIVREIIFSVRDSLRNNHYAAHNPRGFQREIETYRMYICGTSNDLRVALSVTSCDWHIVHDNYSCLYWFNIHHYFEFYQWTISDLSGFVINVWRDSQGQPKHCLEMSFRGNSRVSRVISVSNSCIYINMYLSEFAMEAGISSQFPSLGLPWPMRCMASTDMSSCWEAHQRIGFMTSRIVSHTVEGGTKLAPFSSIPL